MAGPCARKDPEPGAPGLGAGDCLHMERYLIAKGEREALIEADNAEERRLTLLGIDNPWASALDSVRQYGVRYEACEEADAMEADYQYRRDATRNCRPELAKVPQPPACARGVTVTGTLQFTFSGFSVSAPSAWGRRRQKKARPAPQVLPPRTRVYRRYRRILFEPELGRIGTPRRWGGRRPTWSRLLGGGAGRG